MATPRALWPLVWAVLQLGWPPRWLLGTPGERCSPSAFLPARRSVPEGDSAEFTCSLPCVPRDALLNWYRVGLGNHTTKLAAFPEDQPSPSQDRRFSVTPLPGGQDFRMHLAGTRPNDSGMYMCGVIYLRPNILAAESPHIELTVTERDPHSPTERPSPTPRPASPPQSLAVSVTSVLAAVLLLLLLAWGLASSPPRGLRGACAGQSQDAPLKESTPAAPVFTVDYGELDFEWREKTPEPPGPTAPEQTEYATIVFPGRPAPPPAGPQPTADRGPSRCGPRTDTAPGPCEPLPRPHQAPRRLSRAPVASLSWGASRTEGQAAPVQP